ncbi:uncharacterized protein LOC134701722 [Mytilus trossulus]|uniref:uncharacterized protein LOC134701722 n=1 Tax=Mytilus trossulus TaxID=6551 RepID=UPI0030041C9D
MNTLAYGLVLLAVIVVVQSQLPGIIKGCPGCSVKGVCYFPNQEWKQGCWTKKCVLYSSGDLQGWKTPIVKTQCPDNLGRCVDHGQQVSDGCFCKVNGWQWSVIGKCYGK